MQEVLHAAGRLVDKPQAAPLKVRRGQEQKLKSRLSPPLLHGGRLWAGGSAGGEGARGKRRLPGRRLPQEPEPRQQLDPPLGPRNGGLPARGGDVRGLRAGRLGEGQGQAWSQLHKQAR